MTFLLYNSDFQLVHKGFHDVYQLPPIVFWSDLAYLKINQNKYVETAFVKLVRFVDPRQVEMELS